MESFSDRAFAGNLSEAESQDGFVAYQGSSSSQYNRWGERTKYSSFCQVFPFSILPIISMAKVLVNNEYCYNSWLNFLVDFTQPTQGAALSTTMKRRSALTAWSTLPIPRRSPSRRRPRPPSPRPSSSTKYLESRASSWRFTEVWWSPSSARFLETLVACILFWNHFH